MQVLLNKHPRLVVVLCGLLAGGVYSFGFPSVLLPLIVAIFLATIASGSKARTAKNTVMLSCLFFWAFNYTVLIWFLDTDMALLAGLSGQYSGPLLALCLIIMSAVLTLVSVPFALVIHKFKARLMQPSVWPLGLIASAWVVMEWARSMMFSLFLYAPGASVGDYWNFGSLGLSLVSTPVGFLSRYVGMYGLSAIVILLSFFTLWAIKKRFVPLLSLVALLLVLASANFFIKPSQTDAALEASVLQREGLLDDIRTESVPINFKSSAQKDIVVLSEYSAVHLPSNEPFRQKYVTDRLKKNGVSIDVSADFSQPLPRHNIMEVRNKNNELIDEQTKQLLIPTGEYLPMILQAFYNSTGQSSVNANFARTRQLSKGQPPRAVHAEAVTIAPVACSGILGRNIYRQLVNDGGEVLTNSASLITFSGSQAYFRQSMQMARFHAIANKRTYIQSSTGASAFVLDENGEFTVKPDGTATEFIDFQFKPVSELTPYTRFGEWVLVAGSLILMGSLVTAVRNRTSLK